MIVYAHIYEEFTDTWKSGGKKIQRKTTATHVKTERFYFFPRISLRVSCKCTRFPRTGAKRENLEPDRERRNRRPDLRNRARRTRGGIGHALGGVQPFDSFFPPRSPLPPPPPSVSPVRPAHECVIKSRGEPIGGSTHARYRRACVRAARPPDRRCPMSCGCPS